MARKQSDYLAALLADEPAETDAPPPLPRPYPNGRAAPRCSTERPRLRA